MPTDLTQDYDNLYRALGRLAHEWAWMESGIARLIFDLAAIYSEQVYKDAAVGNLIVAVQANVDLRSSVAIVKALAFPITEPKDLFARLEPVLNDISVDLRNTRNRYIHDRWLVSAKDHIVRYQNGTKLPKEPGSGKRSLTFGEKQVFSSIKEIEAAAEKVHAVRLKLNEFHDELQEACAQKYPC